MAKEKNILPVEDVTENSVFAPIEEEKVFTPRVKKSVDVDAFIKRKLKVINEWPDGTKKRAAVERLFRNKEAKK